MVVQPPRSLTIDARIAAVAARQHAQVSAAQLRALGVTPAQVRSRVAAGRLFAVHAGVFAVGVPATTHPVRWRAAVLASGPGAVLAGRSAAAAWALLEPHAGAVEVLTDRAGARGRPGIALRRARVLPAPERTTLHGLPVATPARVLLDVAATSAPLLPRALREARVRGLAGADERRTVLDRGPRPGARLLRAELAGPFTRSELERRFVALVAAAGLPAPRLNVPLLGFEVDAHWPAARVVVELDGGTGHGIRRSHDDDRRRDAVLAAAGIRVLRFTWWDVTSDGHRVVAALRAALPRGS